MACARSAVDKHSNAGGNDLIRDLAVAELREEIDHYRVLEDRVIDQTRRRILECKQMLNTEKIYSIFELHT